MTKINTYLAVGASVVLLLIGVGTYVGWHLHKDIRPCPTMTTDTITIHDTTTYYIHGTAPVQTPDTIFVPDSIILPADVDTMLILRDYYSIFKYDWAKQDSNIDFKLKTTVTRNRPIAYDFNYKLLKPQQTIITNVDKSVHYAKYLYGGITVPLAGKYLSNVSVDGIYAFPRGYAGASWQPYTGVFSAKAGIKILQLK
jgi:hypothetical protein